MSRKSKIRKVTWSKGAEGRMKIFTPITKGPTNVGDPSNTAVKPPKEKK